MTREFKFRVRHYRDDGIFIVTMSLANLCWSNANCKVIGNIYENPDLLDDN